MLTIFTIPKPFTDPHIRLIQRNAIQSWKSLHPEIDIILLGADAGIAETAREFGVRHIPDIDMNEFGTPLLDSAFAIVQKEARYDRLMYANADIIFLPDLIEGLKRLPPDNALTIGRRTDLDVDQEIDLKDPNWSGILLNKAHSKGRLHSWAGMDYFIFTKGMLQTLPPFAVGRVGWDNWMVAESRRCYRYTIDATASITAIHQNHTYSGTNAGTSRKTNPEAVFNNSFTKKPSDARTIEDANWKLLPGGLKRNRLSVLPALKRRIRSLFS